MKKKIAIIIDDINSVGGTQTFSKNLQKILKVKYQVEIISLLTNNDKKKKFIHLGLKRNIFIIFFGFFILYKLKNYDYCIIVSGQAINYFLIWGQGAKYIYRESNLPLNRIKEQNIVKKKIQTLLYMFFIRLNKQSKFIAPSKGISQQLIKLGLNKKRVFILENPVPKKIINLKNLKNRSYNLVFAGRPTYVKGFDRVIKYANQGIKIDFFGPKIGNLSNNIKYRGCYSDKLKKITDSKVIIIPSRFEGYPNIFLEALNAGCFIILSSELKWLSNIRIADFVYTIKKNSIKDLKKKLIIVKNKIKTDNITKLYKRIDTARSSLMTFENYYKKVNNLLN